MANVKDIMTGIAIGVGATLAAGNAKSVLGPIVKPVTKQSMKAVILGYERSREWAAVFAETISDLSAEVQWQLQAERTEQLAQDANTTPAAASPAADLANSNDAE